jgi:hypothetical protein
MVIGHVCRVNAKYLLSLYLYDTNIEKKQELDNVISMGRKHLLIMMKKLKPR